jgi:hypothetical protein
MIYILQWFRHIMIRFKGGDAHLPIEYIGDTDYFD